METQRNFLPLDVARCVNTSCQLRDSCLRKWDDYRDGKSADANWINVALFDGYTDERPCEYYIPVEITSIEREVL